MSSLLCEMEYYLIPIVSCTWLLVQLSTALGRKYVVDFNVMDVPHLYPLVSTCGNGRLELTCICIVLLCEIDNK